MIQQDNIIQLVFDKIFGQITSNFSQLQSVPFSIIKSQTFENKYIHQLINKLTYRSINQIEFYLQNKSFQRIYLISKLRNKIDAEILLGNLDQTINLIQKSYCISNSSLKLAVINGNLDILKYLIVGTQLDNKVGTTLLTLSAEFDSESIYFYLRELGFDPNIQTYNKAVSGSKLSIVQDVNTIIGLSKHTIELAFKFGTAPIIEFVVEEAINSEIKIDPNLISYPILNADIDLVKKLSGIILTEFESNLLHSAILSGSVDMIKYIESQIPNVHNNLILDMSRIKKGQASLLLDSTTYEKNQKKYFSHTINYAVQSKSLPILKYIHGLGYGITLSNIITGIQSGVLDILEYLLQNYDKKLPMYLIHYFNIDSYLIDKISMAKLLISYGFDISLTSNQNLSNYKLETAHLKLILGTTYVKPDLIYDTDYLMNYQAFFIPPTGYKLNRKLITRVRICVELNLESDFDWILNQTHHEIDKQFIMDATYLFGKINFIKKVYQKYLILPSRSIIREMLCYGQIGKLVWLMQLNILPEKLIKELYQLILVLADPLINSFGEKFNLKSESESDLNFIIASRKSDLIATHIKKNQLILNLDSIKQICLLDDINLISEINLVDNNLVRDHWADISKWLIDNDLREIWIVFMNSLQTIT